MTARVLKAPPRDRELEAGFARIRAELDIDPQHDRSVVAEANEAARSGPRTPPDARPERLDRRDIALVAVDPEGSRDLDQAYFATRRSPGYRISYAIADVAAFVPPGGPVDQAARNRGVTLYSPDIRASLHPDVLNESAASLVAGGDRPAALWTIDLDDAGRLEAGRLERAMVRVDRAISYRAAQDEIDSPAPDPSLALLREIGERRLEIEREREAVSLALPAQEIVKGDGGYELEFDVSLPVERWNAQISLLTGMVAADIMIDHGVGLLRTLPRPFDRTIDRMRRCASGLDVEWPRSVGYAERVRSLDPNVPSEAAVLTAAARGLRGAGYLGFTGGDLPDDHEHSAIAAPYAHVTAPLRRVCDRFANEILLAQCADLEPPSWAVEALDELPSIMGRARSREGALERALLDFTEAMVLRHRIGEIFPAVVLDGDDDSVTVQLRDPAVITRVDDPGLPVGERVDLRLLAVDVEARWTEFEAA